MYGSSASAPVMAAMVSLLNGRRKLLGLPPVGYLNPTLYAVGLQQLLETPTPSATPSTAPLSTPSPSLSPSSSPPISSSSSAATAYFRDVLSGNNKCCSSQVPAPAGTVGPVCCSSGFSAVAGWDPASGWGSVSYRQLVAMLNGSSSSISDDHSNLRDSSALRGRSFSSEWLELVLTICTLLFLSGVVRRS